MCLHTAFIVQDHASGLFLFPYEGSVGLTRLARDAGHFDDEESAVLTAADHCETTFSLLEIIVRGRD